MEMETTLLGGGGERKGGWGCADLNDTHCRVIISECLNSFCKCLSGWLLCVIHDCD